MTIREIRIFNSKIRKLERLSEQYLDSKIKIEIENKKLKQKLKNTRKALDVAFDALKTVRRYTAINQFAPKSREAHIVAKKALEQITALEQKDK